MVSRPSWSSMGGFTLLEIMVALAIFATLAAAVLSASQYVVKQRGAVEARLFAAWLADNRLNELRLQRTDDRAATTGGVHGSARLAAGSAHQRHPRSAFAPGRDSGQSCEQCACVASCQRLDTRGP